MYVKTIMDISYLQRDTLHVITWAVATENYIHHTIFSS